MAVSYNDWKKQFEALSPEQQKKHVSLIGDNHTYYQQYLKEQSTPTTPMTPSTPTTGMTTTGTPNTSAISNGRNNVTAGAYTYNPNNNVNDTFGDSGFASTRNGYTGTGTIGTNNYTYNKDLTLDSIKNQNWLWGDEAIAEGQKTGKSYITPRNDIWANAFLNSGITDAEGIKKYLQQYKSYTNFFEEGQNNTVQALLNRIGELQKQRDESIRKNNAGAITIPSTLPTGSGDMSNGQSTRGGIDNTNMDYWTEVNQQMQAQVGFNWGQFSQMYPEEYQQMRKNVEALENLWYSGTDSDRESVRGQLRQILGTLAGYGSEMSQNRRYNEAYNSKFANPDRINKDIEDVMNLQTRGLTDNQIAQQLGMDVDQVRNLVMTNNGDSNADLSKWYQLSQSEANKIKEPFDRKQAQLDEQKEFQIQQANIQLDRNREDLEKNLARQEEINARNIHNADMLAGRYGLGVSNRGVEGLQTIKKLGQQVLDDLIQNADRRNQDILNGINEILMNYRQNSDDITWNAQQALNSALNTYSLNVASIQQRYGVLGMQAQQQVAQAVQNFIAEYDRLSNEALQREQNNFTFLLNGAQQLQQLNAQNLAYRQAVYEQYGIESINMTREEAKSLKNILGFDASNDTLEQMQVQAVANVLNGYGTGAGNIFLSEIDRQLGNGYTGTQVIENILKSEEFKERYGAGATTDANGEPLKQYAMSNGILYNQYTGEYENLNSGSDGLPANIQKVKLNDGSEAFIDLATGEMVDPTSIAGLRNGVSSSASASDYKSMKTADGKEVLVNPLTGEVIDPDELLKNQKTNRTIENFKSGLASSTTAFLRQYGVTGTEIVKDGQNGGQCGTFVNDYLNSLGISGRVFGSTLESKEKAITPGVNTPLVGACVIMDTGVTIEVDDGKGGKKTVPAGHVGIVTQVNDDGTMLITDSNWGRNEKVMTHKVMQNSKQIKGYYIPGYTELANQLSTGGVEQGPSAEESYNKNIMVANLTKDIFGGNASDSDREMMKSIVEDGIKLGKSRADMLYDGAGFQIKANNSFASNLMSYMESHVDASKGLKGTYDLQSIANRINANDLGGAIKNMEESMIRQFSDNKSSNVSQSTAISMMKKLQILEEDFEKIKGLTGKFSLAKIITETAGGTSGLASALGIDQKTAKEIATTASDIQQVYAQIRNQLAGTAVTENESKWLSDMLPSLNDNSTVFSSKLQSSKRNIIEDQNGIRDYLGLPLINENSLIDWNERVKLYGGNQGGRSTTGTKIQ